MGLQLTFLLKNHYIYHATVSKATNTDLKMKSYRFYEKHIFADKMKAAQAAHRRKLLNDLKSHGNQIIFFWMRNNGLTVDPTKSRTTVGWTQRELMSSTS
uniref:Uncharacterized protein n=1 Tax=Lepeophtheirus salmonis TaxID=72036 RepID=A0A0K2U082_LEPSM